MDEQVQQLLHLGLEDAFFDLAIPGCLFFVVTDLLFFRHLAATPCFSSLPRGKFTIVEIRKCTELRSLGKFPLPPCT